jgi:hypothetical protein
MSTPPSSELVDFAEAPGAFMEPAPGLHLLVTGPYTITAETGHAWTAVERLRLRADEVGGAVAAVDAFMREAGTLRASWWLSERSTPDDLEELLLEAGCRRDVDDYLNAGMVLTREPPAVDGVAARLLETAEERLEALAVQQAVFGAEVTSVPEFAAWIDGRIAAVGRTIWTRVGGYLVGGATAEWARGRGAYRAVVRARWDEAVRRGTPALAVGAGPMSKPILERLGFEQLLQFRRIESVRSGDGS